MSTDNTPPPYVTTRVHPESSCPRCGTLLDGATNVEAGGHRPSPGDYSLCCACLAMLTFTAELKVRELTEQDEKEANPETLHFLKQLQANMATERALLYAQRMSK